MFSKQSSLDKTRLRNDEARHDGRAFVIHGARITDAAMA
jgi:hypothetical protein